MSKIKLYIRSIAVGMPIATIIASSFFPLQAWGQQALVLFVLLWFNVFIVFDILGK
jgi:hypothetical protein